MPLKSEGLRLPAIEILKSGTFLWINSEMFFTSSGERSSIAIKVCSNQPFSFRCFAKSTRKSPQ